jgi:CRISPR-associated protein (TIGR02584 family)
VITGLSPQVVTETIWALAQREPPAAPQEIVLLTTAPGEAVAQRLLPPALRELSAQLGVALPPPEIQVMRDRRGQPLDDISSTDDNQAAADAITAAIRVATADPDVQLHVSIAGGRKTMGCLAGMALSLFGRAQDQLTHVLVDARFQAREDFFFPPDPPRRLPLPDGGTVDTRDCRVVLAEIPFVRLRGQWRAETIGASYAAAVEAAQAALLPPVLELDARSNTARFGAIPCRLTPSLFGILLWFAERASNGEPALLWSHDDGVPEALARACLASIARAAGSSQHPAVRAARRALAHGMDKAFLAEKVSRLNRLTRDALGPDAAPYLIQREGRRPNTAYRLALPPEAITVVEDAHGC